MADLTTTEEAYVEAAQRDLARWGQTTVRRLVELPWLTDSRCRAIVRELCERHDGELRVERVHAMRHLGPHYRHPSYRVIDDAAST